MRKVSRDRVLEKFGKRPAESPTNVQPTKKLAIPRSNVENDNLFANRQLKKVEREPEKSIKPYVRGLGYQSTNTYSKSIVTKQVKTTKSVTQNITTGVTQHVKTAEIVKIVKAGSTKHVEIAEAVKQIKKNDEKPSATSRITQNVDKTVRSRLNLPSLIKKYQTRTSVAPPVSSLAQVKKAEVSLSKVPVLKSSSTLSKTKSTSGEAKKSSVTTAQAVTNKKSITSNGSIKSIDEGIQSYSGPVTRAQARKSSLEVIDDSGEFLYFTAIEDSASDKSSIKEVVAKRKLSLKGPPPGVKDIDKLDLDEESGSTYAFDTFEYLKSRERVFKIPDYMKSQTSITGSMRALLVDWLVELQEGFELYNETLYLCVKLMDTYLSKNYIVKTKLQLLGCACMLIASKYEETAPVSCSELVECSYSSFTADDLLAMELKVLKAVDYNIGFPLGSAFIRRYTRCCESDIIVRSLSRFILEMSLLDYTFVPEFDSRTAAAALFLSHMMVNKKEKWNKTLEYYSGYKAEDFYDLVHALNMTLHKKFKSDISKIQTKYANKVFHEVSKLPPVPLHETKCLASKMSSLASVLRD